MEKYCLRRKQLFATAAATVVLLLLSTAASQEFEEASSDLEEQGRQFDQGLVEQSDDGLSTRGGGEIQCPLSVWFTFKDSLLCKGPNHMKLSGITSVEECLARCTAEEECEAYSYKAKQERCFLKSASCMKSTYRKGFQSGVKHKPPTSPREYNMYSGILCDGSTLSKLDIASEEECRNACDACPSCQAYSYRIGRDRCLLKKSCRLGDSMDDSTYISGVLPYADPAVSGAGGLECEKPELCPGWPSVTPGWVCPEFSETVGESTDLEEVQDSPYQDILDGEKAFNTTFPERLDYPSCPFRPPNKPLLSNWADHCIKHMRGVGFLEEIKGKPNKECPAGWFLCKGMCYTLVQRNNRGPEPGPSYYDKDYMGVEQRCGTCGGARVAFVGDDPEMQRVAAEAARQTINEDKATWVRRFRFLKEPSEFSESGNNPYQPWHRFVTMSAEDKETMTYQRYYTGEKDGLDTPQYDKRFRNQEASILCVNTIDRIKAATKTVSGMLTMEEGCEGNNRHDIWDNDKHRWFPEHNWPFPGH